MSMRYVLILALKKAFGKKWVDEDAAIELIVKELKAAKEYSGIQTIVDATPINSGGCKNSETGI